MSTKGRENWPTTTSCRLLLLYWHHPEEWWTIIHCSLWSIMVDHSWPPFKHDQTLTNHMNSPSINHLWTIIDHPSTIHHPISNNHPLTVMNHWLTTWIHFELSINRAHEPWENCYSNDADWKLQRHGHPFSKVEGRLSSLIPGTWDS